MCCIVILVDSEVIVELASAFTITQFSEWTTHFTSIVIIIT